MSSKTNFTKLVHRINRSYGCFLLWKYIRKSISIPDSGKKEATRRSNIMNHYDGIFSGVLYAVETTFIIDLHKFFDKSNKNLTLKTFIKNLPKIDQTKIDLLLDSVVNEIKRIEVLRHNNFAHEPKTPKEEKIFIQEIEKLFLIIQEILNICGKSIGSPNMDWSLWEDSTNQSFSRLLDDLEKGSRIVK